MTALYEIVPAGEPIDVPSVDPLKYQDAHEGRGIGADPDELMTVKLRYKEPDASTSQLLTHVVRNATSASQRRILASPPPWREFGMLLRNSEFKGEATWDSTRRPRPPLPRR